MKIRSWGGGVKVRHDSENSTDNLETPQDRTNRKFPYGVSIDTKIDDLERRNGHYFLLSRGIQ